MEILFTKKIVINSLGLRQRPDNLCDECSRKIHLIRSTRVPCNDLTCGMISNQLNTIEGTDLEQDTLRKLGNRVKTLRMQAGHHHYERFAHENNISRLTLRRCENGGNIKFSSLLKIIYALNISAANFFSEGFE